MSDDRKLFGVGQTLRVIGCGMVDLVASCNPSRVGVVPEGLDELAQLWKVYVIRRSVRVKILED